MNGLCARLCFNNASKRKGMPGDCEVEGLERRGVARSLRQTNKRLTAATAHICAATFGHNSAAPRECAQNREYCGYHEYCGYREYREYREYYSLRCFAPQPRAGGP